MPTPSSTVRTGTSLTRPPATASPIRFSFKQARFSSERGFANGTCENGTTPGRVMVWVAPDRATPPYTYADPPPPVVDAYEMTWVGADRYEVLFPQGAVTIGDTDLEVVADCSGATTRKSGKSLLQYGLETDLENAPIGDQPYVIISGKIDPVSNIVRARVSRLRPSCNGVSSSAAITISTHRQSSLRNQCAWIQTASFEPASRPDGISTN